MSLCFVCDITTLLYVFNTLSFTYVSGIGRVQKPMDMAQLQNAVHNLRSATPGDSKNRAGLAFYSILKATEKVPYDSGILLFTGRAAEDEDLAAITTENLTSKRCKVSSGRKYKVSNELSNSRACLREIGHLYVLQGADCDCAGLGHDPV
jgi:hypothetical protein